MNRRKSEKRKGVLTVEALIILPIYYVVFMFIISILSLSYHHLVMQQALNNAGRVLAQYGHVANMLLVACSDDDTELSLKSLGLQEETNKKEVAIEGDVKNLATDLKNMKNNVKTLASDFTGTTDESGNVTKDSLIDVFANNLMASIIDEAARKVIETRVDEVMTHVDEISANADNIKTHGKSLKENVQSVNKADVINYLVTSALDLGGGKVLELIIDPYLVEAQTAVEVKTEDGIVQKGIFKNRQYHLYIDANTADFILVAEYDYSLPFNLIGDYHVSQSVRVHPWIGGDSEGLAK